MKKMLIALSIVIAGCNTPSFKELPKDEQLLTIKLNIVEYCGEKLKSSDLVISNYITAYKREKNGVKSAASQSPYDDLHFINGHADSVEISLSLPNTAANYAKNAAGHPLYSTGLRFKLDDEGKVKSHTGYALYFGDNEKLTVLEGKNSNLLFNSFKN